VVIGGLSILGFEQRLTPSGLARGMGYMARLMVRRNNDVAARYHEFVID
jgi:hypothetical protein